MFFYRTAVVFSQRFRRAWVFLRMSTTISIGLFGGRACYPVRMDARGPMYAQRINTVFDDDRRSFIYGRLACREGEILRNGEFDRSFQRHAVYTLPAGADILCIAIESNKSASAAD